jgi:hypothetical protein
LRSVRNWSLRSSRMPCSLRPRSCWCHVVVILVLGSVGFGQTQYAVMM